MCGITGFLDTRAETSQEALERIAAAMAEPLRLRGPDAGGVWADASAGIAFGHRRLSIVDLTPAGAQPMISASGHSVLCYNGEIYNGDALRPQLEARGVRFRGRSDTEIILEACEAWGPVETAKRLIGMFAFAWWDGRAQRLFLVRDRLGIKPLYWSSMGGAAMFASQPKSFFAHPAWKPALDRDSLAAYFRFGYVPGPHSIYRHVRQVAPGSVLSIARDGQAHCETFWNAIEVARAGVAQRFSGTFEEAVGALDALLHDAVGKRMIADVPLGAFLSGGIDSSTVVALMQAQSAKPVKTFSIGFEDAAYDEAPFAKAVAAHLGTDHHELYVPARAALDTIPTLAERYDEPFADASQIPTLLVSQMTRSHVTVALSGDGGDELFGGYPRYDFAGRLLRTVERVPPALRRAGARGLRLLSPAAWEKLAALAIGPARAARFGERLHKASHVLETDTAACLYRNVVSVWLEPRLLVRAACEPVDGLWAAADLLPGASTRETMQLTDLVTYLPDDILTKVDRASMAMSLEARVPLLDHRVVAFAWSLPPAFKNGEGKTKRILRAVLERYVPTALFERPKRGFEVPLAAWLRGPLRDWAEDLLSPAALEQDGVLTSRPIRDAWAAHLAGRADLHNRLWAVLMFQQWRKRWKPSI
jgi:asparagine synthase (glutamine-hydrolysing)